MKFKQEAVNQIVVHGYSVSDVSERLGVSTKSLYDWQRIFSKPRAKREADKDLQAENARLKRGVEACAAREEYFKGGRSVSLPARSKSATRL